MLDTAGPGTGESGTRNGEAVAESREPRAESTVSAFPLTVRSALAALEDMLDGVPEARQEARDIVAALLDVPRFWPSVNAEAPLERATWEAAARAAGKRASGAPFAYAVGRAAFRNLTLDVDERVLIPRQETETLVEEVLRLTAGAGGLAIDVGTGSGAIALALATEGRFARVIATDVSRDALAVAGRNVEVVRAALRCPVDLRHGAYLAPVRGERATLVVSNPPYIAHAEAAELPASVRDWEPGIALYAGRNGMAAIVTIVREAAGVLEPGGLLALEVDSRRASLAAECVAVDGRYEDVCVIRDLAGRERIVTARRTTGPGTRDRGRERG